MEHRIDTPAPWVRAVFTGSFAYFLGLAGHVMGDGPVPGAVLLVVLFAMTVVGTVPFLARPASALRLLVLLAGGQTFIHVCLAVTAGQHGDPSPASAGHRPQDGLLTLHSLTDLSGHLVAAALVALWLAHGERRVFTVLQLTARRLLTRARPAVLVTVRLVRGTTLTTVIGVGFRDLLLGRTVSRRGPPLLAA
jgi:hypothetical protein